MKIRFPLGKAGDSHYKILLKIVIIILFIYFWLAGSLFLGGLFSSCSKWGLLSRCGVRLFTVVAALVAGQGLQDAFGLQQLRFPGSRAQAQ